MVRQKASILISPIGVVSSMSRKGALLAAKPICTKIPSNGKSRSSLLTRSLTRIAVTLSPFPTTFVVCEEVKISTFGKLCAFSCSTWSAFSVSANSKTVTFRQIPAKSMAASIPEFPPPITATSFP